VKDPQNPKAVTADFPEGWADFTLDEIEQVLDDYGIDAIPREIADEVVSTPDDWNWAEHDCEFVDTVKLEILTAVVGARHPWMLAQVARLWGMVRYGCLTEATFEQLRRMIDVRHGELCRTQAPVREPDLGEYQAALRWGLEQAMRWSEPHLHSEMRAHLHTDFLELYDLGSTSAAPTLPAPPSSVPPPDAPPVISLFTKQPIQTATPPLDTSGALALQLTPQTQARLTAAARTDSGNAELFAQHIAGRFVHVSDIGWHAWDGARVRPDASGAVRETMKDLFTSRLMASNDVDEQAWLRQSLNNARMNATLKWAESVPVVQASPNEFDRKPLELVTPGGIVNLATGDLRPANPLVDRNMKATTVTPDFTPPTRFLGILRWAFGGDEEMIRYVQRLFGLALIGELRAQIFPVWIGSGANGKSLIFHVILSVIGSYGMKLSSRFLVLTRSDQHPEEIAQLSGVRLALASEVPRDAKYNEELIKALTGDPTGRARLMRENSFEFSTTVSLMLAANHLPSVPTGGPAWWRRQRLIEMNRVWPEAQRDDSLADQIVAAEGPQVLAWMIAGAADYLANGEQMPAKVRDAVARYRVEEDTLARFVAQKLEFDPTYVTTRQGVYQTYQMWANMNRVFPVLSEPKFARELLTIYPTLRSDDGDDTHYLGVRLAGFQPQEVHFDPISAVLGN